MSLELDEAAEVRELARVDARPVSGMLRRLVLEALEARRLQGLLEARLAGSPPEVRPAREQYETRPPADVRHPFSPGGPNGRCAENGCGQRKLAGVHGG